MKKSKNRNIVVTTLIGILIGQFTPTINPTITHASYNADYSNDNLSDQPLQGTHDQQPTRNRPIPFTDLDPNKVYYVCDNSGAFEGLSSYDGGFAVYNNYKFSGFTNYSGLGTGGGKLARYQAQTPNHRWELVTSDSGANGIWILIPR